VISDVSSVILSTSGTS